MTIVLERLKGVKPSGPGKWQARCPAHDDHAPSLSISSGDDGRILLHCFAGCDPENIVGSIGLKMRDLMPNNGEPHRNGKRKAPPPRRMGRTAKPTRPGRAP